MQRLLTELRRRKVTRAVIAYAVAAFALIEVADVAVPRLGLPDAAVTWLVWLALAGLPVVVAASWFFDVHPDGGGAPREAAPETEVPPDALRKARWSGAVAAVAVLVMVWGAWTALIRPADVSAAAVIDGAERIAILPFRPAATDEELTRVGRDLVVTVSTAIESLDEIRLADPTRILNRVEEVGGPLTPEAAIAHGRELGASAVVVGTLVGDRDGAGLTFRLLATDDGRELARGETEVRELDLYRLTDATTVQLLRGIWRQGEPPTENLEAVTTESREALVAFLEGEEDLRAGLFDRAFEHFERSARIDTTFALPHWRLIWIREWGTVSTPVPPEIEARYRRLIETLPPRERMHASVSDSSRTQLLSDYGAIRREYPDYAPVHFEIGDVITHHGSLIGIPATEIDPTWAEARRLGLLARYTLGHYQGRFLRLQLVDSAMAMQALMDPASFEANVDQFRRQYSVLSGLESFEAASFPPEGPNRPVNLVVLAERLMGDGTNIPAAERALAAAGDADLVSIVASPEARTVIDGFRSYLRTLVPAARGRYREAFTAAGRLAESGWVGGDVHQYRIGVVGVVLGALSATEVEAVRPDGVVRQVHAPTTRYAPAPDTSVTLTRDFLDGVLALHRGDAGRVSRISDALRDAGADYLASSLELHRAIASGDTDAALRLVEVEYAAADVIPWDSPDQVQSRLEVVALNRRVALEALLELDRFAEAERLSLVVEYGNGWEGHWARAVIDPLILPLRARALEGLGRSEEAAEIYRDYLARMEGADPAFDDLRRMAREGLERVGGGAATP